MASQRTVATAEKIVASGREPARGSQVPFARTVAAMEHRHARVPTSNTLEAIELA